MNRRHCSFTGIRLHLPGIQLLWHDGPYQSISSLNIFTPLLWIDTAPWQSPLKSGEVTANEKPIKCAKPQHKTLRWIRAPCVETKLDQFISDKSVSYGYQLRRHLVQHNCRHVNNKNSLPCYQAKIIRKWLFVRCHADSQKVLRTTIRTFSQTPRTLGQFSEVMCHKFRWEVYPFDEIDTGRIVWFNCAN